MNILDIIVIGLLVAGLIIGSRVGLIKMIFGTLSTILSIVIAYIIYPIIAVTIKSNTSFSLYLQGKVGEVFNLTEIFSDPQKSQALLDNKIILSLLPKSVRLILAEGESMGITSAFDFTSMQQSLNESMAGLAINILTFIATLLLVMVIMWFLSTSLNLISKLPVIKGTNKLAGMVAGLVLSSIAIFILMLVLGFMFSVGKMPAMANLLEESLIAKLLYDYNILMFFLK